MVEIIFRWDEIEQLELVSNIQKQICGFYLVYKKT